MGKRSNLILTISLAVFVIGAAAIFLVARNGGDDKAAASDGSSVLYAAKDIPSGTSGADAVAGGLARPSRWTTSRSRPTR
ncbi:MAG: hypothetical protein H0T70_07220 [Acidimicrobiia bacterium]|nr:hypothetical protein [Acidimicrobiia bacterium]